MSARSYQVQEEENLVRRAQERDPDAFAQLYEQHFDRIYRYILLRVWNQTEAEDLTQQVFLHALQSIASYKWRGLPFSSWLFRIAHNQIVDYVRKAAKGRFSPLDESLPSTTTDPASLVEKKMDIEQLIVATRQLTKAQQEVIALRFAGDLPTAQVAKVMDKSEGAVKALQHSALVRLRQILRYEND